MVKSPIIPTPRHPRDGSSSSRTTAPTAATITIQRVAQHKARVKAAGLEPKDFAGHSLRSGYATQAARDGYRITQIAATTRHQDQRVLAGYIRSGTGKDDTARVL